MRFSAQTLVALLASPLMALAADNPNPFTNSNIAGVAGKTLDLTWTPTTGGSVSIILRSGNAGNLTPGVYVAQGIANSGKYSWSIPSDITRSTDYALEIVDDADPTKTNYIGPFYIDSTNTVASSTPYISQSGSATASSAASSHASSASSTVSSGSSSRSSAASSSASKSASSASSSMASSASKASSSAVSTGMAAATAIPLGLLALGALAL